MTVLRTHRFNDIWQEMNRWQQHMGDLFGERDYAKNACGVFPPINTYDNGESYIVRAEIPGISLDDLDITATATQLTLKGERSPDNDIANRSYHRAERDHGSFNRTIDLGQPIDPDKIDARYENGVLEIVLPRAAHALPRQITVKN